MGCLLSDVTLVTAFYDIGRSEWNSQFNRKSDEYVESFRVFLSYDYDMIIYIDDRYYEKLKTLIDESPHARTKRLIPINEKWMSENIWAWSRLPKEKEIMSSDKYRRLIPHRIAAKYPENVNPEYTIITHSKIDFICNAIDCNMINTNIAVWVDFGYFRNKTQDKHIPKKQFDLSKLDTKKVNLCGMHEITEQDRDVLYTLSYAPVKICAYLFAATKENMKWFQSRCHEALEVYQMNGLADDEQGLWLLCYFADVERYKVHYFPEWHMGFKHFTKD